MIFDSQLVVKHAFDGMVHHDLTCAPVWDSWKKKYVGLLSVSDFLDILSTADMLATGAVRRGVAWRGVGSVCESLLRCAEPLSASLPSLCLSHSLFQ